MNSFRTEASDAQAHWDAVQEISEDALIGVARDESIASWSRAAERLYGYAAPDILGQPFAFLFPPDGGDAATALIQQILAGEHVSSREMVGRGRDRQPREVALNAVPVLAGGDSVAALFLARNLAPQRQMERTVRQIQARANSRALVLETANRVALDILAQESGRDALHHIADAACRLTGADTALLGVAAADGGGLQDIIVGGPNTEGTSISALSQAESLRLLMARDGPWRPPEGTNGNFLGVPIRRGAIILGGLYLSGKDAGQPFTEADEASIRALAAHAAVAFYHHRMLSGQRALVSSLINAQEEERRAVACDLHDGLTQYVMAAKAHLQTFRDARDAGAESEASQELDLGLRCLQDSVLESRRLVNGLRTLALDDLGLAGALELLLQDERGRAGWADADFAHNVAGRRFDKALETAVYRVAQEALTNVRRHADARRVSVALLAETDAPTGLTFLTLDVRDWGGGFDATRPPEGYSHVGLTGMAERTQLMDGRFEIQSVPGEGTRVRAAFPVQEPRPAAGENQ